MAPLFDGQSESIQSRICKEFKLALSEAKLNIKCDNCACLMRLNEDDKIIIGLTGQNYYIRCFSCNKKVLFFNRKILDSKLEILYEEYKRQPGVKISKKQFYKERRKLSYGFVNIV